MTKTELYTAFKTIEELTDKIAEQRIAIIDALPEAEDDVFGLMDELQAGEIDANECYAALKENDYLDCFDGEEPELTNPRRY